MGKQDIEGRRIKLALLGSYPAASVLPAEMVRPKYRAGVHPAPWIAALCPELMKAGNFEIRVFVIQRAVRRHALVVRDGIAFECIPFPFPERFNIHLRFILQSSLLKRHVARFAPDMVHAFGLETGCATMALRLGSPASCFIQGIVEKLDPYLPHVKPREKRILLAMERNAVRRLRWMIAETAFARDWALSHNSTACVAIIPHALRPSFLARGNAQHARQIISVGGMDERKGMDTILTAFALLPDQAARLCLVGRGPLLDALKRQAAELGVAARVEFTGALDEHDVIERLNASSVFAIGSRMDTSPNVVTEAHAVGLPVVGTRAGGIPEMIDDGRDGFLVGVDDVQAMADRLDRLLSRPDEARALGAVGREKVRRLNDPYTVAVAHAEFFRRMAAGCGVRDGAYTGG